MTLELMGWLAMQNKQVPGDVSALVPGGLRMGSPALTSRGFVEKDFERVAEFVDRAVAIAVELKKKYGPKLKDFRDALNKEVRQGCQPTLCALSSRHSAERLMQVVSAASCGYSGRVGPPSVFRACFGPISGVLACPATCLPAAQVPQDILALKKDVETFAMSFPTIGFEKSAMRYKS
jgi:hypothetical protein